MDASDYSEEEDEEDEDDEDYGIRRRSSRTSTRQNYRASRKSGRGTTRRSRRQNFDDFGKSFIFYSYEFLFIAEFQHLNIALEFHKSFFRALLQKMNMNQI